MSKNQKKQFLVTPKEQGMRLLAFLKKHLPESSSVRALKRAIESKKCKINGRVEVFSTYQLRVSDKVELLLEEESTKSSLKTDVLYEDEYLLICNKPVGFVCENARVAELFPDHQGALTLVHRLDKETSGVLLLAKTRAALEKMIALFEEKEIEKSYLAIVDGAVKQKSGKAHNFLAKKHAYQGQTIYASTPHRSKGKESITLWKCLQRGKEASLLQCDLMTGRTHQLRVHLSEMGHPILGDHQYGERFLCSLHATRHLLHAYRLRFMHPLTGKKVEVVAPPPKDFLLAMKSLGWERDILDSL